MKKGVYVLLARLKEKKKIEVGSLGTFEFEPGLYCYVGSGMNNLDKRVERHFSEEKKKHWHIDYFLEEAEVGGAVKIRTERDLECELNKTVEEICEKTPVPGFGSSDCKCRAHLHILEEG
ncbi:MAG: GIY-YIG nuclease family protein [Candidatus Aenigmatarchaeota archaeon]